MTVPVKFHGGPLHDMKGQIAQLDSVLLFFDKRQKQVLAYKRSDELAYDYELKISKTLTGNYDDVVAHFGSNDPVITWQT